ncbi:hypothetical protein ACFRJ5_10455, partial [Streptomyces sp. NPDC056690]
ELCCSAAVRSSTKHRSGTSRPLSNNFLYWFKGSWLATQPEQKLDPDATLRQLDEFEADARGRGVTHTTFRRITEALGLHGAQRQPLRALLLSSRPEQYQAPLWHIPAAE